MARYTIQTPDGRKVTIEAADEATAIRGAQEWATANPAQAAAGPTLAAAAQQEAAQSAPPPAPRFAEDGTYADSHVAQGLSGLNEGVANVFGFPVDAMNMLTGLGMSGINSVFGTDLKPSQEPYLGSASLKRMMADAGTTVAPSEDADKQFLRRVAQEAPTLLIPASRAGITGKQLLAEATGVLAGGSGAAAAQQMFPGNPVAELAGNLVGSFAGPMAFNYATRNAPIDDFVRSAPTTQQLIDDKNLAYARMRAADMRYSPAGYDDLLNQMYTGMAGQRTSTLKHPAAVDTFHQMARDRGQPASLESIDDWRQIVSRDVAKAPDLGTQRIGAGMIDTIDDWLPQSGRFMTGGNRNGVELLEEARGLNSRMRNTQDIERRLEKAEDRAASTGTGGNINNTIRQNVRNILDNPNMQRGYSPAELEMMRKLVRSDAGGNGLRLLARARSLWPAVGGAGLATMFGGNPALALPFAALTAGGWAAKVAADRKTRNLADQLRAMVATGQSVPAAKSLMTGPQAAQIMTSAAPRLAVDATEQDPGAFGYADGGQVKGAFC